jgi:hypothetical protein
MTGTGVDGHRNPYIVAGSLAVACMHGRPPQPPRCGRCLRIEQVICVGTLVSRGSAMMMSSKRPEQIPRFTDEGQFVQEELGVRSSSYKLKSLILAQIERWRRA